jgi:hypothetical protein
VQADLWMECSLFAAAYIVRSAHIPSSKELDFFGGRDVDLHFTRKLLDGSGECWMDRIESEASGEADSIAPRSELDS